MTIEDGRPEVERPIGTAPKDRRSPSLRTVLTGVCVVLATVGATLAAMHQDGIFLTAHAWAAVAGLRDLIDD